MQEKITISIDPTVLKRIDEIMDETGIKRSTIIERFVLDGLMMRDIRSRQEQVADHIPLKQWFNPATLKLYRTFLTTESAPERLKAKATLDEIFDAEVEGARTGRKPAVKK